MMKVANFTVFLSLGIFASTYSNSVEAKIVTPETFGAAVNDNIDDSNALQQALNSLQPGDTLSLKSGTYDVQKTIGRDNASQVVVQGTGQTILQKRAAFTGQYLLTFRFSQVITIKGIEFRGLTNNNPEPVWGEEGVYLASSKNTLVEDNIFRNFGDSALRITTSPDQPDLQSSSARVRRNKFENVTQVTTTQATQGTNLPGTANILFENNTFENNRGGLKISTRAPISYATIKGNVFNGGCSHANAIEISSYSNVTVDGNTVNGCQGTAITAYPNSTTGVPFIPWGGLCIVNNNIINTGYGIRIAPFRPTDPASEFRGLTISSNRLNGVRAVASSPYNGIIWLVNQHPSSFISNLKIENNLFSTIPVGANLLRFVEGNPPQAVPLPRGTGHIIQNNRVGNSNESVPPGSC